MNNIFKNKPNTLVVISLVAVSLVISNAEEPPGPVFAIPDWSESELALSGEWLNLSVGVGEPGNAPDVEGSDLEATLTQLIPGATVTGSQNIYHPAAAASFAVTGELESGADTIQFQTWVVGTELDYDSMKLTLDVNGESVEYTSEPVELFREAGGFGDTVIMSWVWNELNAEAGPYTISFESTGPHTSFVAARLDILSPETNAEWLDAMFDSPSQDRWGYPFNITPGRRTAASIFGGTLDEGLFRNGIYIIGFDTDNIVEPGHSPASYQLDSVEFSASLNTNFKVVYDPTPDSVFSFLPLDHEQYQEDIDAGRPFELLGAGFRNGWNEMTWEETTEYATGENADRNVYPALINESGEIADASLGINFNDPMPLEVFATGIVDGVEPGELIPEESEVRFSVDLSNPNTRAYIQRGLSLGRLYFTVTGYFAGTQEGVRTFPEFKTSENLLGVPPQLELSYRIETVTIQPEISSVFWENGEATISFTGSPTGNFQVRYTQDLVNWTTEESPELQSVSAGSFEWVDTSAGSPSRLYQVIQVD